MTKTVWHLGQSSLLSLMLLSMVIVLGRAISSPKAANFSNSSDSLRQEKVPLSQWQLIGDSKLDSGSDSTASKDPIPAGVRYQYQQGNHNLTIDLRYVMGDGDVSRFLSVYSPVRTRNLLDGQRFLPNVGYYSVLTNKGSAYLTACLNPKSHSTVTESQFRQARLKALNPMQLLRWFEGQAPLFDDRCLWTLMSMPLPSEINKASAFKATESTYQEMERVWVIWYNHWKKKFPPYEDRFEKN